MAKSLELKRVELMGRIERGEELEPGPYTAWVEESSAKRFSEKALVGAGLTAAEITALKARLPETTSRSLKIALSAE
jgi:hypothetical protein